MVNPSFSSVPSIRKPDTLYGPISSQPGLAVLRVQNVSAGPSLARQRGSRPRRNRSSFASEC